MKKVATGGNCYKTVTIFVNFPLFVSSTRISTLTKKLCSLISKVISFLLFHLCSLLYVFLLFVCLLACSSLLSIAGLCAVFLVYIAIQSQHWLVQKKKHVCNLRVERDKSLLAELNGKQSGDPHIYLYSDTISSHFLFLPWMLRLRFCRGSEFLYPDPSWVGIIKLRNTHIYLYSDTFGAIFFLNFCRCC